MALAGKPEAFRKAGRRSRSGDWCGLLIWTAVGKPYPYNFKGLDSLPSASSGQAFRANDRRIDTDPIPNDTNTPARTAMCFSVAHNHRQTQSD